MDPKVETDSFTSVEDWFSFGMDLLAEEEYLGVDARDGEFGSEV
jgi:hypothetical protein